MSINNITESKLNEIIKKQVQKTISEYIDKHFLFEMAYRRGVFKEKINCLLDQIIQNWCLVHYCTLVNREQLKKHWKEDELQTHLMKCASYNIQGNNSSKARAKALNELWSERDFNSNLNTINLIVNMKFRQEKIDVTTPIYQQCLYDCMKASNDIIKVIADANINNIIEYTNSI